MGYFYLILQALIFSFGGLLIKSVGTMLSPFLTSCLRFTIGIAMLFLIQRFRTGKLRLTLTDRVILIGGVCKALHYLAENFGVMRGFSYGGVLVWPVQTVVVFLVSRFFYKEGADYCTLAGTILCIAGVITISWNGASLSVFLGSGGITMAALVLAGIGAAGFSISQKARIREMDVVEMNLRLTDGNKSFRIDSCAEYVDARAVFKGRGGYEFGIRRQQSFLPDF